VRKSMAFLFADRHACTRRRAGVDRHIRETVRQLPSLGQSAYDAACAINDAGIAAGISGGAVVTWNVQARTKRAVQAACRSRGRGHGDQ